MGVGVEVATGVPVIRSYRRERRFYVPPRWGLINFGAGIDSIVLLFRIYLTPDLSTPLTGM